MGEAALCRGLHLCLVGQQRRHGVGDVANAVFFGSIAHLLHREEVPPSVHRFTSHTPNDAFGPYQVQSKPDGLNVVGPTYSGKDEFMDNSSPPRSTGLVDQPYSSHVFTGYTSVPAQAGVTCIPTHTTNINHLEFCNEVVIFHRTTSGQTSLPDWRSDRRIRHYPNTPYAASSDTINVPTGQVKVVNEAFQTNPSAGHKNKVGNIRIIYIGVLLSHLSV
ncbi:hypothetical protein EDC04DRAFT_2915261 [Pisolithus marmoratus]|nr:hypothetical protein EDC04DRAFT_2915261 [Pisolithus marmoratus]